MLITERSVRDKLPEYAGHTLLLDAATAEIDRQPDANLSSSLDPENLAYVLYTSGSTGLPKGVEIEQRSIVNMLYGMARKPGFTADDVVLAFTTLSFDLSVYELFMPAVMGGKLVLATAAQASDGRWLDEAIRRHGVTVLQATPSTFRLLVASGWAGERRAKILTGGEALPRDLAEQLLPRCKELWNCYGPTETTVWTHRYLVTSPDDITLGDQFENVTCYVLDDLMELLPTGVAGEVWIGGTGVARGYRDRDDLTNEKFFRNPYRPGDRIYRSGDVIRRKADGRQVFVGRADHQVKIRGFRIELGEIETVLAVQPGVKSCIVHTCQRAGDPMLVGYVQHAGEPPEIDDLQAGLRAKLPEYMIPSAFVFLKEFPHTPNGKIDRKALPAPQLHANTDGFVAPRTETEKVVAALWREVLEVERVGALDDFFDLGGHSLKAAQLSANVRERFGVAFSLRSVFADPTVAGVAAAVDELLHHTAELSDAVNSSAARSGSNSSDDDAKVETSRVHITLEHRHPLTLWALDKISTVDAAALAYLPASLLDHTGLSAADAIELACQNLPLIAGIQETSLGRIAVILLPRFDYQLYHDRGDLLEQSLGGLKLAKHLGARMVSLTGLLPSATDYGCALAAAAANLELPQVTTGHATTTSAVVLSIRQVLRLADRPLEIETVAFLGLGSIGSATLRLLLSTLPHPAELILCDVFSKRERLESLAREARKQFGFAGKLEVLSSGTTVPDELYRARTIVGATNVADILDVARLHPGTIIVDDSAPHCFNVAAALKRFDEQGDILFTEGGVLAAPATIPQTAFVPPWLAGALDADPITLLAQPEPRNITGCILSSVLTLKHPELAATVGSVDRHESLRHFERLVALGYDAAALHCDGRLLDTSKVDAFRERFSGRR